MCVGRGGGGVNGCAATTYNATVAAGIVHAGRQTLMRHGRQRPWRNYETLDASRHHVILLLRAAIPDANTEIRIFPTQLKALYYDGWRMYTKILKSK